MNDEEFIRWLLWAQAEEREIGNNETLWALRLIDEGKLGMDGFKYCTPELAKENRARILRGIRGERISA